MICMQGLSIASYSLRISRLVLNAEACKCDFYARVSWIK
jgi:hypothetical protein